MWTETWNNGKNVYPYLPGLCERKQVFWVLLQLWEKMCFVAANKNVILIVQGHLSEQHIVFTLRAFRRWIWVRVLRWTSESQTIPMYKLPFFQAQILLAAFFKISSVFPHADYHSHIQMAGWKKDGFWLLSLCLLNCSFSKDNPA